MPDIRARVVALVHEVQGIPYAWPGEPTASAVKALGRGTCASKHALLAEELDALGVRSLHRQHRGLRPPRSRPRLPQLQAPHARSARDAYPRGCCRSSTPSARPSRTPARPTAPSSSGRPPRRQDAPWPNRSPPAASVSGTGPWTPPSSRTSCAPPARRGTDGRSSCADARRRRAAACGVNPRARRLRHDGRQAEEEGKNDIDVDGEHRPLACSLLPPSCRRRPDPGRSGSGLSPRVSREGARDDARRHQGRRRCATAAVQRRWGSGRPCTAR